jgi:hypothetical protein
MVFIYLAILCDLSIQSLSIYIYVYICMYIYVNIRICALKAKILINNKPTPPKFSSLSFQHHLAPQQPSLRSDSPPLSEEKSKGYNRGGSKPTVSGDISPITMEI